MTSRRLAIVMSVALIGYFILAGWRGFILIREAELVPILLGLSIIVLPLLGAWMLWRELAFGMATAQMGKELAAAGRLDPDDLPRTPSGRIELDAAHERFERVSRDVQMDPDDWSGWYRLAVAYDDARDRKEARRAMRKAWELYGQSAGTQ